ncbi:acyltransferase family protein [Saccharothrix sp. 6-C]|uniref:acyltransferase family protein n=1 Tax=Saccharothrix sp. 6-C TaxID=2781735 RepID=UPI0019170412|nr:acyltransferase [Saccharothrix sp. 6-C]QQQ76519.1 acyltransferase family protein [Saccharothrix sp. 6-C]
MRRLGRGGPLDGQTAPPKVRIAFIDIGRGLAALLVFYSHIAEQWVAKREVGPTPGIDFIDALTSDPMHMGLQGIGQIAVPFFFLVSGFVVTPIALRQGQRRFGLNRLVRVYIPMTFVVLLTAAVILLGAQTLIGAEEPTITWWTVVTNSLVINYLIVPQVVMVGVAWTLVVEVVFYLLLVALLPVMRRWTWLAIGVQLTFVFVVMMSAREFGASWALFAVNVSYLPIPIIGQIIWATTSKRVPLWLGGLYVGIAWSLYVLADFLKLGRLDTSYNLALAFALLFFMAGYFAESRLKERRIWIALSERSYSIYLLHGLVAFVTLDLMRPAVPLLLAIPLAVALTFGVVELSYRYVEKPSHALARKLSRKPAPEPEPEPELEAEADELEDDDLDEFEDEFDDVEDAEWPAESDEPDEPAPVRETPTEVLRPVRLRTPPPQRTPPRTPPQGTPLQRTPPPRTPPRGLPVNGAPRRGVPAPGTPPRGLPVNGTPAPGTPPRGTPVNGSPVNGSPVNGSANGTPPRAPANGSPVPGTPPRGTPAQRTPVRPPPRPAPPRPAPPPVEDATQYLPAAVWPVEEPEADEAPPPRRRRLREDDGPAVTVASLLANHAKENGHHR